MAYEKKGTDFPCPRQHKYKNSAGLITNAQPLNDPNFTDRKVPVVQRDKFSDEFNYPATPAPKR